MPSLAPLPDMLGLLYNQHRNYTAELGRTHQALSKLYKKIAKTERVLAERERKERHLTRDERKKWQYSRCLAKRNIADLESQQVNLHDAIRQCNDLIASLDYGFYGALVVTPWTGHFIPPSPYMFSPFSPVFTPGAPPMHNEPIGPVQTQYWDLSSLPERQVSPSPCSADSGFHEPQIVTDGAGLNNERHVYAHEMMSTFTFDPHGISAARLRKNENADQDVLPEMQDLVSPMTRLGALEKSSTARSHKRCVSASVAQPNLGDLAAPWPKRGTSVGPVPDRKKNRPDDGLGGNA
ncbi:hypothetical protein CERZMDRAFT_80989 [Cercospora zeae-maydis SCOH1-5]|uniref:Uncharacterized protein n=1 Tax=Cercospora zeae-maydis SCOH1-5 TaxID=717836 RepID=A0A6A6FU25_9PEZI|nr:hypothetical protein CERZMDRAFT_80989 [Cercospora zeae-maydis SCOH1-5]